MQAECTEANSSREQTKAKTSEKGFSDLEAKLADKRLTRCEASRCSRPSTDKTKGACIITITTTMYKYKMYTAAEVHDKLTI